jgi:hypothetical protein
VAAAGESSTCFHIYAHSFESETSIEEVLLVMVQEELVVPEARERKSLGGLQHQ